MAPWIVEEVGFTCANITSTTCIYIYICIYVIYIYMYTLRWGARFCMEIQTMELGSRSKKYTTVLPAYHSYAFNSLPSFNTRLTCCAKREQDDKAHGHQTLSTKTLTQTKMPSTNCREGWSSGKLRACKFGAKEALLPGLALPAPHMKHPVAGQAPRRLLAAPGLLAGLGLGPFGLKDLAVLILVEQT